MLHSPKLIWRHPPTLLVIGGSGILMAMSAAPINVYPLAWVALIPLWVVISPSSVRSNVSVSRAANDAHAALPAIWLALIWGISYHGSALSWILGLHPLTWMGIPWLASIAIAIFCWLFITLWGTVSVMVWVWLMQRPRCPRYLRILWGTVLWCSLEWLRSLGALDWTSLAFTQSPGNLAILHLGRLSGPLSVTAAIVAVNGLLAEFWLARKERQYQEREGVQSQPPASTFLIAGLVLLIGFHLVGFKLLNEPLSQPEQSVLKIGIVQGNVPTRIKLFAEGLRQAEEGYTRGYETLAQQGVDAVLTPEGALPILWNRSTAARSQFQQAILRQGVIAWLGTFTAQPGGTARSLLTIAGDGATVSRYDKIKLVPLGEYVPFNHILGKVIGRLTPISEDGVPGSPNQRFNTPLGRAIASICYDSAFPQLFRSQAAAGGLFILTASNLDPYSEALMAQHQAQDLMRAVETDRWAVRATNTGYSSVIDPHGKIVWRSQPHTYVTHAATIYPRSTQTLYVRWGDWLTPLLWLLTGLSWAIHRTL